MSETYLVLIYFEFSIWISGAYCIFGKGKYKPDMFTTFSSCYHTYEMQHAVLWLQIVERSGIVVGIVDVVSSRNILSLGYM